MKVKMLTILASPDHRCDAGKEINLPDDFALALVEGGFAVRVDLPAEEQAAEAVAEEAEEAVEEQAEEPAADSAEWTVESAAVEPESTAALPPAKGKRRS